MQIRVGYGYDVHRLVAGRPFILGGVDLKQDFGPDGHSDADVLIHAICDALLGAANLRDIGFQFPDNDPAYRGVDSKILLREVVHLLVKKGYRVGNVDATVVLEMPKVNPHIPVMQAVLAPLLGVAVDAVSIKATTSEKMGFVGRKEGVAAHAVVLIQKQ